MNKVFICFLLAGIVLVSNAGTTTTNTTNSTNASKTNTTTTSTYTSSYYSGYTTCSSDSDCNSLGSGYCCASYDCGSVSENYCETEAYIIEEESAYSYYLSLYGSSYYSDSADDCTYSCGSNANLLSFAGASLLATLAFFQ